jgi:hypothetical protein
MTGFAFIAVVLVAALLAGFKSRNTRQLPSAALVLAFTAAAGLYLFAA